MENKLFAFFYNPCIHESAYQMMSIHRTKRGAEIAMEFHKQEAKKEHDEVYRNCPPHFYIDFGKHEDWSVDEIEIKD